MDGALARLYQVKWAPGGLFLAVGLQKVVGSSLKVLVSHKAGMQCKRMSLDGESGARDLHTYTHTNTQSREGRGHWGGGGRVKYTHVMLDGGNGVCVCETHCTRPRESMLEPVMGHSHRRTKSYLLLPATAQWCNCQGTPGMVPIPRPSAGEELPLLTAGRRLSLQQVPLSGPQQDSD